MFRATSCSSSGESIVSILPLVYVTVCRWPFCEEFGKGLIIHVLLYQMAAFFLYNFVLLFLYLYICFVCFASQNCIFCWQCILLWFTVNNQIDAHFFSMYLFQFSTSAFLKLWSADHKWSSGSALVVLLDWTLVQKRQKK